MTQRDNVLNGDIQNLLAILKGCVSVRILRGSPPEAQQCAAPGQFTVRSQRQAAELEQHPESA
jgi:hypothetical protein